MHYIQTSIGVGFKILVGDPLFFPLDGQTKGGVVVGTTGPTTTPVEFSTERRLMECNAKSRYALLGVLIGSKFIKVMHYSSTKEIWDKLKNVYEGDGKFKGVKLQTYRGSSNT